MLKRLCEFEIKEGGRCIYYIDGVEGEAGFCKQPDKFRCIPSILKSAPRLSNSSIQDYMKCKRLYWIRHIMGIQKKDCFKSNPLKMGTLMDNVVERIYARTEEESSVAITNFNDTAHRIDIDEVSLAKVISIARGYRTLIQPNYNGLLGLQYEFFYNLDDKVVIHGFYDRKYEDRFVDTKFTSKPQNYSTPFHLRSQFGTYFLADDNMQESVVEIIRVPELRHNEDKESIDEYKNRIYEDILRRPSYYFIGYDGETETFGLRMARKEFNLDEIKGRYIAISKEIVQRMKTNDWYCEETGCFSGGFQCDFLDICENEDYMSEEMFEKRVVEIKDGK